MFSKLKALTLLLHTGAKLDLKRWDFSTNGIDFHGYAIHSGNCKELTHMTDGLPEHKQHTNVTRLQSFLSLYTVFRGFLPNFARVPAPWKKKLLHFHPQTFDAPINDGIAAFETLKARLGNKLWWLLHIFKVPTELNLMHAKSRVDVSFSRHSSVVPTDQLDIGQGRLKARSAHPTPPIESISLCGEPYTCSGFTWKVVHIPAGMITMH